MTKPTARAVLALLISVLLAGGSVASAGGAANFGERAPKPVTTQGGAANFGE
jgi:hypothetical protein